MNALVIEGVMRRPEELGPRFAAIERCVVLARHEADILVLQPACDLLELRQPSSPLGSVIGGVREVAGEDNEVWLHCKGVDRRDGFRQRVCCLRIDRGAIETPVGIRQLHEIELGLRTCSEAGTTGECGGEHDAAESGESQKLAAIKQPWTIRPSVHGGLP